VILINDPCLVSQASETVRVYERKREFCITNEGEIDRERERERERDFVYVGKEYNHFLVNFI
jgi:hypothetical protein